MEPWEALDVDDSDLPSLLRPCKRLHSHETAILSTTAALSQPVVTQCSHSSITLADKEAEGGKQRPEEKNLLSDSHYKSEQRRVIPGPAGAVQLAMLQKTRDRENHEFSFSRGDNSDPIPTQEYIRRAVENTPEFDDDFGGNPWLSALHYIGMVDGVVHSTPLNSIKECTNSRKVDQIVAVIKSCTQCSLGGFMLTLKDPTGAIGAFMHQKVLSENNLAQDISVGSVLILQKVAVFCPSYSVHYLNITLRNLVKVFSKDIGPPPEQNHLAYCLKYGVPSGECFGKACSPQKTVTPEHGACEETLNEMEQISSRKAKSHNHIQIEKENIFPPHLKHTRSCLNENASVDKETSSLRQDALKGFFEAVVTKKTSCDKRDCDDVQQKVSNPHDCLVSEDASRISTTNHIGLENQEVNIVQKERRQLISTASLPQWTDEQLEELFAGDDENGDIF